MADNNIALGVKQPEPVNYLGQMAQVMAIKAAQNEMQGNDQMRAAYGSGSGDWSDPAFRQKMYQANPAKAAAMEEKALQGKNLQSEVGARDVKTVQDELKMYHQQLGSVNDPAAAAAWVKGVYGAPMVGSFLARTVPMEQFIAGIPQTPGPALDAWKRSVSLEADKLYNSADAILQSNTSIKTAGIAAGASRANNADTIANAWRMHSNPNMVPVAGDVMVDGQRVPTYMGYNPKANTFAPAQMMGAQPPTVPTGNALAAPAAGAAVPVGANALAAPPVVASPVAVPSPTAALPNASAAATNPANTPAGAFVPKLTPTEEKMGLDASNKTKAKANIDTMIGKLYEAYSGLSKSGGIVDTTKSGMENLGAGVAASSPGQYVGKMTGSPDQGLRNTVDTTRPLLLAAIKEATGMSAKQMDSNVELQFYLKSATDPSLDIKTNIDALNTLSAMYGLGKKLPMPEGPAAPPARDKAPAGAAPAKIASDADYNALKPGAEFIAPDGSHRRKP